MATKSFGDCVGNTLEIIGKIQEHFNCGICLESVKIPMMCSKCSKIFCKCCINRWLELRNRCPHCRHNLTPDRLVKCGWVDQITEDLETVKTKDMCESHRLPLSIYCRTCSIVVCAHCALFDNPHQSHEICPIDEVFSAIQEEVQQETKKLKDRFIYLNEQVKLLDRNIANCEGAMVKHFKETHADLKRNLEQVFISKRNHALEQKQRIEQEMDFIANVSVSVDEQGEAISACDYLAFAESIKAQLVEAQEVPLSEFEPELQDVEIFSGFNVSPPFTSITVTLYEFSNLKNQEGIITSQVLSINGRDVRLNIKPNGTNIYNYTPNPNKLIEFKLETVDTNYASKSMHEFKLEVINQFGNKSKDRVCQFYMELGEGCPKSYEIPISLLSDNVEKEGFCNPDNDCLVVKLLGRSVSYESKCKDQTQYIRKLERIALEQEAVIKDLRAGKVVNTEDIPTRHGRGLDVASSHRDKGPSSSRGSFLDMINFWKL